MTALLEPFTGFVPAPELAHRVVGPPSSVLSPADVETARLDPLSFRHAAGRGAGSTHEQALEWLRNGQEQGALRPVGPAVLAYRVARGDLAATGFIADVRVGAYDEGLIKGHESTITRTERKMADYIRTTRIHGNPIALVHRPRTEVADALAARTSDDPDTSFVAVDGSAHELWIIEGDDARALCAGVGDVLYITDGHHRLAAASLAAREEGRDDARLPAGVFATGQLEVWAFGRCVVDPDLDADTVIDRLASTHLLEPVSEAEARPRGPHEFGVRIGGGTYRLRIDPDRVPDDPYRSLDVNLLQDLVLEPILGITDPRQDARLRFIPDRPETAGEVEGCGAWFLPFPASVEDVMTVADLGMAMPPKSTLFAPKLPSGLVIGLLDQPDQVSPTGPGTSPS